MKETNRFGQPIEQLSLEEIISFLKRLPGDKILALCAALIHQHQRYTFKNISAEMSDDKNL